MKMTRRNKTKTALIRESNELRKGSEDLTTLKTQFKKTEEALRNANFYDRSLIEVSLDPLVTINFEGKITDVNKATEKVTGITREKLIGDDFSNYFTEPEKARAGYQKVLREGSVRDYPLTIRHASGKTMEVLYNATVYYDRVGQVQGVFAAARDITERKRMEKALCESENKFRMLAEFTYDWIYWLDNDSRFIYSSPSCERITGYQKEEFINDPSLFLRIIHPDDQAMMAQHRKTFQSCPEHGELEFRIIHRDGSVRWLGHVCRPVPSEHGGFRGRRSSNRDITERKRMEEEIARSQSFLSNVIEQNPTSTWISDDKGTLVRMNQACRELFRVTEAEVVGKYNLLEDNLIEAQGHMPLVRDVFKKGKIARFTIDYNIREVKHIDAKAGTHTILDVVVSPIRDEQGKVTNAIVQHKDITDLKQAEDALRESESKFKRLYDSNIIGIIFWDTSGNISRANSEFLRIVGYTEEDVLSGRVRWKDMTPPEYAALDEKALKEMAETGVSVPFEKEYIRKDGSRVPVVIGAVIFKGHKDIGICFVQDITERKRAEKALRESEERFFKVFHANPVGLSITRLADGQYIDVNEAFLSLFGYESKEALGHTSLQLRTWASPEERNRIVGILREQGRLRDVEAQYRRKSGETWTALVSGEVIEIAGERCALGLLQDITERKKTEEKLKLTLIDLARSNKELEQFAYVASHDLQEPLRMVASFTQLLEKRHKGKLDAEADEYIEFAVDGANRMQRLINDLLTYSRVSTRGKPLEPCDCQSVLGQVIINLKPLIDENQALITNGDMPTIAADETQMIQLFQNLIGNAIKFRRKGSPQVHISAEQKIGEWQFSVRDNGIGIEPQYKERIFIVFQRLHGKDEYQGTGIGLAICKKIVERHGGRIWLDSEPGKGSTFYFTIPER